MQRNWYIKRQPLQTVHSYNFVQSGERSFRSDTEPELRCIIGASTSRARTHRSSISRIRAPCSHVHGYRNHDVTTERSSGLHSIHGPSWFGTGSSYRFKAQWKQTLPPNSDGSSVLFACELSSISIFTSVLWLFVTWNIFCSITISTHIVSRNIATRHICDCDIYFNKSVLFNFYIYFFQ